MGGPKRSEFMCFKIIVNQSCAGCGSNGEEKAGLVSDAGESELADGFVDMKWRQEFTHTPLPIQLPAGVKFFLSLP